MTSKQSTKKGGTTGKGRGSKSAASLREDDLLTAKQIRAILSNPSTSERVTLKLTGLINTLCQVTDVDTIETPDFYASTFAEAAEAIRAGDGDAETLTAFAQAKLYAEQHEPKDARLVRRLSAMLRDPKADNDGRVDALLDTINGLSTETRVGDLHPDVFETVARVLIREARKGAAVKVSRSERAAWLTKTAGKGRRPLSGRPWMLKRYLRELETLASE